MRVFPLSDEEIRPEVGPASRYSRGGGEHPSPPICYSKEGNEMSDEERIGYEKLREFTSRFETRYLEGRQSFISDGDYGIYRYNPNDNARKPIITVPTLHIRDPSKNLVREVDHGLNLWKLCDPVFAKEFHHSYGHDFPRGRREMKKISQLIRDTAQESMFF